MEQGTALELVKKGATLLLLDVPQHTLIGIDTQIYSAGPHFKGIKMIPPGTHFFHYCPANRTGNAFSAVLGCFITLLPSEVVVRKWHQQEEKLVKLSEEEEGRYSEAVRQMEFDSQLGPYALDRFGAWKQISNYITKALIERIEPIGGEITIAYESEENEAIAKTKCKMNLINPLKQGKVFQSEESLYSPRCYYTPIPNTVKCKGVSGEELTSLNLDKTELLESILLKKFGGAEDLLLGELQFAFVAFLMGQSLEAFYQWKALTGLIFGCLKAPLHTRTRLFVKFITVIYYQLKHGSHGDMSNSDNGVPLFLDDSLVSKGSFLHHACKEFFCLIEESRVVDGDLLTWKLPIMLFLLKSILSLLVVTSMPPYFRMIGLHPPMLPLLWIFSPWWSSWGWFTCLLQVTRKLRRLLESMFGLDFQHNTVYAIEEGDEFSPVIVYSNDLDSRGDQVA